MDKQGVPRPRKRPSLALPPTQSQVQGSFPLLSCPPEILLLIAKRVANLHSSGYNITAKPRGRTDLFNFSHSNKTLREACVATGLLTWLTPPKGIRWPEPTLFDMLFGSRQFVISCLEVDIGNVDVWELCAHIMEKFPNLDGLVLSGCAAKNTKRFCESKLGAQFTKFTGTSITLKQAVFSGFQSQILFLLGRSNVTSFSLLGTEFNLRGPKEWTLKTLFPKLARFVFNGLAKRQNVYVEYHPDFVYQPLFSHFFLPAPNLVYFELLTGSRARLLRGRIDDRENIEDETNTLANYFTSRTRFGILRYLQEHVKTLQVFVDNDSLDGPFLNHTMLLPHPHAKADSFPRFEKMKLLVFRCEDPGSLTAFGGTTDDCTVGSRNRLSGSGGHSVWQHVIDINLQRTNLGSYRSCALFSRTVNAL